MGASRDRNRGRETFLSQTSKSTMALNQSFWNGVDQSFGADSLATGFSSGFSVFPQFDAETVRSPITPNGINSLPACRSTETTQKPHRNRAESHSICGLQVKNAGSCCSDQVIDKKPIAPESALQTAPARQAPSCARTMPRNQP